jgi:hypothetical protein
MMGSRVIGWSAGVLAAVVAAAGCSGDPRSDGSTTGSPASAQVPSPTGSTDGTTVLFVRGADGSGGFLEGGSDDQLSDIRDRTTTEGNHGWGTLADRLEDRGYSVSQVVEPAGAGPARLDTLLAGTDVLVLGSNNADYSAEAVSEVVDWVRRGGGLLVISDANWGQSWADAAASDQPFLQEFDLVVNQDHGRYAVERRQFVASDHPLVDGVDAFDGEGVSPFTVVDRHDDVEPVIVAPAAGDVRRPTGDPGPLEPSTDADAALVAVPFGQGRMVGHYDRNTFFNRNGAGTDITRVDNAALADNIIDWLAGADGS